MQFLIKIFGANICYFYEKSKYFFKKKKQMLFFLQNLLKKTLYEPK